VKAASISKGESYKQLIKRMDDAITGEFYLEASWIAYAIIEDRLLSALAKTGGVPTTKKGDPIRMLGPKLQALRDRLATHSELRAAMLPDNTLDLIDRWKESRNPLMHSMAEEAKPFFAHSEDAKALALEGKNVTRALCSAVMRLAKRKIRKQRQ
jgi:hypothetical protein